MLDPDVDSVLAVVRSASLPDTLGDFGSIEARSDTEGCDRVRECRCRYSFVGVVLYVTLSDVAMRISTPDSPIATGSTQKGIPG